jgi:hypothetical protein
MRTVVRLVLFFRQPEIAADEEIPIEIPILKASVSGIF